MIYRDIHDDRTPGYDRPWTVSRAAELAGNIITWTVGLAFAAVAASFVLFVLYMFAVTMPHRFSS